MGEPIGVRKDLGHHGLVPADGSSHPPSPAAGQGSCEDRRHRSAEEAPGGGSAQDGPAGHAWYVRMEIATYWQVQAQIVRAWNTSWNPNRVGLGSGHLVA